MKGPNTEDGKMLEREAKEAEADLNHSDVFDYPNDANVNRRGSASRASQIAPVWPTEEQVEQAARGIWEWDTRDCPQWKKTSAWSAEKNHYVAEARAALKAVTEPKP